uniref:Nicotinic acid mononucleotide adenylyltransferase, NAD(P)-dependent n=1 Tax=mine drainage metagenome TaxID=410659 RepID=E6QNW2_9ZZZZ
MPHIPVAIKSYQIDFLTFPLAIKYETKQ